MRNLGCRTLALALALGVVGAWPSGRTSAAEETQAAPAQVQIAGVFVRRAFNEEGMVVVGFHTANDTVGQEHLMLEVAMTTLNDHRITIPSQNLRLITPAGEVLSLMSQEYFLQHANELAMLGALADTQSDSLNYLPKAANVLCPIRFFSDPSDGGTGIVSDALNMSPEHACVGRVYFEIPGGTQYETYALAIKFDETILQVPFRLMTKEEVVEFRQSWKKKMKSSKKSKDGKP